MHNWKRKSQIEKLNLEFFFSKSLQEKHEENKNKEVHEELKEERKALDKMATAEIEKNIMYTRQKYFIKIF